MPSKPTITSLFNSLSTKAKITSWLELGTNMRLKRKEKVITRMLEELFIFIDIILFYFQ
jgi:hypothetical protein